jgi:hypothetical protein
VKLADVYHPTSDFYTQQLCVNQVAKDRRVFFAQRVAGRKVLHVGCTDWPVFDPASNLHRFLFQYAAELVGYDVDAVGIERLRRDCGGRYFTNLAEIHESFELVLVPEVIEHTANAGQFVDEVFAIKSQEYAITAPNFSGAAPLRIDGITVKESVHPDHRAWYSPYTLLAACRRCLRDQDDIELLFLERMTMICLWVKRCAA